MCQCVIFCHKLGQQQYMFEKTTQFFGILPLCFTVYPSVRLSTRFITEPKYIYKFLL